MAIFFFSFATLLCWTGVLLSNLSTIVEDYKKAKDPNPYFYSSTLIKTLTKQ